MWTMNNPKTEQKPVKELWQEILRDIESDDYAVSKDAPYRILERDRAQTIAATEERVRREVCKELGITETPADFDPLEQNYE